MRYLQPSYFSDFFLPEDNYNLEQSAPLDLTWTWTTGEYCEAGLSMGDTAASHLILLGKEKRTFIETKDSTSGIPLKKLTKLQIDMIADARRTIDLLIQNREMPLRTSLVAALTYCMELEPIVERSSEMEYQSLDWGYTEQPFRQLQAAAQALGKWEHKHSDLMHILFEFEQRFSRDLMLQEHVAHARAYLEPLGGEGLRTAREKFDQFMDNQDYLFENLLVYYVHRYMMNHLEDVGFMPSIQLALLAYVVIRSITMTIWAETGVFTEELFVTLCCHYAKQMELTPEVVQEFSASMNKLEFFSPERLQRLLWQ